MGEALRLLTAFSIVSLSSGLLAIGPPRQDADGAIPTFHVVSFVGKVEEPERFGSRSDTEFPSGEFPQWFSALATGLPVKSNLNPNLVASRLPRSLTMLDICTFYGSEADSKKRRWDKRKNGSRLTYRLAAVSWTPDEYVVELESWGLHRLKPFRVSGPMTSTMVTAFPVGDKQILFFAVTPQKANSYIPCNRRDEKGQRRWRLIEKVMPRYPENMRLNRTQGSVSFSTSLPPQGKIDATRLTLLECNHLSFCLAAAEAVSQWRFEDSEIGSGPVLVTINVRFVLR